MQKPVIGITTYRRSNGHHAITRTYVQAVKKAGGLPVLIPLGLAEEDIPQLLDNLNGVIFSGGEDMDPNLYGDDLHPEMNGVSVLRDQSELALLKQIIEQKMPFLAICRGIQVLNVGLGGTLYTHLADQLDSEINHRCFPGFPRDLLVHDIFVKNDSKFHSIVGSETIKVNSLHHQAIKVLAPDLSAVGHSKDGLVEAVEMVDYPFGLGVQWHPEMLPEDSYSMKIFNSFIKAA